MDGWIHYPPLPKRPHLVLFAVVWLNGMAMPVPAQAQRQPIKSYTTADGLAHERIHHVLADSRGFVWFSTADGLSRFDGHTFTTYGPAEGLPNSVITHMLETSRGDYWIATNGGGVARFNHAPTDSSRFVVLAVGDRPESNRVNVLFEDRTGRLWAGTDGGVFLYEERAAPSFHHVELGLPTAPDRAVLVWAFAEDAQGSVWIGSSWGLTRRLPDGRMIQYAVGPAQGADHVRAIVVDDEHRIWIGHGTGLIAFQAEPITPRLASRRLRIVRPRTDDVDAIRGDAVRYTTSEGLAGASIRSLHRSTDGQLWIASLEGLTRFDGKRFEAITKGGGVTGALSVDEDREGNVWVGTSAAGAAKIARHGFMTFAETEGLGRGGVGELIEDESGKLYAVSGGPFIHLLDGNRFTTVRPNMADRTTDSISLAVALRDHTGEWWLPGDRGLYRFPKVRTLEDLARVQPRAIYTTRDGLAGEDVYRLFEDSRGDVWIGRRIPTSMVLTRWERATGMFHRYSDAHGLPAFNRTQAFAEDRSGNVWIGFRNGGLARYRNGRFTVFTAADGAPAGVITSLRVDRRGRLWVGSGDNGVRRVDAPADDRPDFAAYTTADGLSSNRVSCVTDDALGRIYFGVPSGVDRFDPVAGRVRHYSSADGLAGSGPHLALTDRQGALWFATLQGLSRLLPGPDKPGAPPAVFIGGLRVAGESYPVVDFGEREVVAPELAAHQNSLQIDFFGMGSSFPLRYQYKLEPGDRDWTEPGDQQSVNYARLSPGTYRFLVRAISSERVMSPAPALVSFTILRPIWQRWWFLALLTTGVAVLTHAIYRYRLLNALELERVRTRIATDLHDDVGANLSQIAILSEVARAQAQPTDLAVDRPLSRIATLSRESVDAMSEIVWAIDPHHDRFSDLLTRMRRLANEVLPPRGIELVFRRSGEQDASIAAVVRREVFLLFKEAITNIARHAECTTVDVLLRIDGRRLQLAVSDDGKGFDPTGGSGGQGLRSMRHRAELLGGTLDIASQPGHGTRLMLIVPFRQQARSARAWKDAGVGPA